MRALAILKCAAAAATVNALAIGALAQAQQRLPRECRQEVVQLCGRDRGAIRTCLQENIASVSESCRAELRERIVQMAGDRGAAARRPSSGTPAGGQQIVYGGEPLQQLDFYPAATTAPAPLILFVHGGGWKRGDKSNATGSLKPPHFTGLGYNFASTNYRLVPAATVEQQAADVAQALAALLRQAEALGIDRRKVVLMGHSAGAHLVSLVSADPQYLRASGLSTADIAGVIPLDGAGYDVPAQMGENALLMGDTYAAAFGTDPARQRTLSPTFHAAAPNAPAWLILHVERPDAERQSEALAAALGQAGTRAEVREFAGRGPQGHMEINQRLGDPTYPATLVVDEWLARLFG